MCARAYVHVLRAFTFDIGVILPFDCLLPYDFISGLFVRTLMPLVVVVALLVAGRVQGRRGNEALSYLLTNGGVLLVFLVYPSITQTVFKFFQGYTFDGDYGEFLIADYSINTASTAYATVKPFAVAMIFVWPVGVPCVIAALLWRNRAPLLELRRRERLLGAGTVYDHNLWKAHVKEETRRRRESFAPEAKDEAEVVVQGYLWSLTESYRTSVFYFDVLEYTLQKLTLVGVLCFIRAGTLEQLVIGHAAPAPSKRRIWGLRSEGERRGDERSYGGRSVMEWAGYA